MTTRISSMALLLILAFGCGKAPQAEDSSTAPRSKAENTATVQDSGSDIQPLLNGLTQQVRKFGVEQQKAPKTLDELVAKGYLDAVPPAPAGKKFEITRKLDVVLTDQ